MEDSLGSLLISLMAWCKKNNVHPQELCAVDPFNDNIIDNQGWVLTAASPEVQDHLLGFLQRDGKSCCSHTTWLALYLISVQSVIIVGDETHLLS